MRIEPVIGEVISALNATNGAWLARMSGSGATCFAIYENTADAGRAAEKIRRDHPGWWVHAGTLSCRRWERATHHVSRGLLAHASYG